MSDTTNIGLFDDGMNKNIPDEKLLAYLEGRLPPDEQREIEKMFAEEGLESDAIEGLQHAGSNDTKEAVTAINRRLRKDVKRGNSKRRKRSNESYWGWVAVIIILLLIALGYIVVRIAG